MEQEFHTEMINGLPYPHDFYRTMVLPVNSLSTRFNLNKKITADPLRETPSHLNQFQTHLGPQLLLTADPRTANVQQSTFQTGIAFIHIQTPPQLEPIFISQKLPAPPVQVSIIQCSLQTAAKVKPHN